MVFAIKIRASEQNRIYLFSQHFSGKSNSLQNAHTVICFAI